MEETEGERVFEPREDAARIAANFGLLRKVERGPALMAFRSSAENEQLDWILNAHIDVYTIQIFIIIEHNIAKNFYKIQPRENILIRGTANNNKHSTDTTILKPLQKKIINIILLEERRDISN